MYNVQWTHSSHYSEFVELTLVTVGSSAGGYAAVLYGSLIGAKKVIAFNAQFELENLAKDSTENKNPLVYKHKDTERNKFYDLKKFIRNDVDYFYFCSIKNENDLRQYQSLFTPPESVYHSLYCIRFNTAHHGIPFLKVALPKVINSEPSELKKLSNKKQSPLCFTISMVGIMVTFKGFIKQAYKVFKKKRG